MTPAANPQRYKHHRFPPEIISHAVWLYFRFSLSYRDVEERLFARGIGVTYEAIRQRVTFTIFQRHLGFKRSPFGTRELGGRQAQIGDLRRRERRLALKRHVRHAHDWTS